MGETNFSLGLLCLILPAVFCLLPIAVVGTAFFWGRKFIKPNSLSNPTGQAWLDSLNSVVIPDPLTAQKNFEKLQAQYPNIDRSALVKHVINKAAFNAGFIGFGTGIWGLPAMPATIPVDFLATGRIQASMIHSIAYAYGRVTSLNDEDISAKTTYMIMVGSTQVMGAVNRLVIQLISRVIGKSIFEAVPVLGGFIGFGINYYLTTRVGDVAIRYYSGDLAEDGIQTIVGRIPQNTQIWVEQQRKKLSSNQDLAELDNSTNNQTTGEAAKPNQQDSV